MIPVKDLLGKALKTVRLGTVAKLAEINVKWSDIVGSDLSKVTTPSHLYGKTLIVGVLDNSFMEALEYSKARIISKIENEIGKQIVTDIKVKYSR